MVSPAVAIDVDERFVVSLWERQAFDSAALEPLGMRVVFRGQPSDAGGPDYQEALLSTSGSALTEGDIEFHVRASDWYRHGHATDAHYNSVILHVVWINDVVETTRADGESVPTVELSGWVIEEDATPIPAPSSLTPPACLANLQCIEDSRLVAAIDELGLMSFDERTEWFRSECVVQDRDQVIFGALLEAMGYSSNRDAFRLLADIAPYAWVMSRPADQRAGALLAAAGLACDTACSPPSRLPARTWRLARLRPANHPVAHTGFGRPARSHAPVTR